MIGAAPAPLYRWGALGGQALMKARPSQQPHGDSQDHGRRLRPMSLGTIYCLLIARRKNVGFAAFFKTSWYCRVVTLYR